MRNVILQHYNGTLGPLEKLSSENIQRYAQLIGADYLLITGKPFRDNLDNPCQKIIMLDEQFDSWDNVVMLDIDMFTVKHNLENIFDATGVGLHVAPVQPRLHQSIAAEYPDIASLNHPFWGGAIYKLSKDLRIRLRDQIPTEDSWMTKFNGKFNYVDEGIMHGLATKANISLNNAYLDQKWCYCSYLPYPQQANIVHIRTKPHRDKLDNYNMLKNNNVFE